MLIIEGPDGSGKTTLAELVAGTYNIEYSKSIGSKADYEWWLRQLKVPTSRLLNQVRDRFFFSELVYGPLMRGKASVDTHQREVIENMISGTDPLVVICKYVNDPEKFLARPQEFPIEKMGAVDAAFQSLNLSNFWTVHYDLTNQKSITATLKAIEEWWLSRDLAMNRRTIMNYGRGPLCPAYMVVGISFSSNNPHKIPFERSASAHLTHQFLREAGIDPVRVYFTNAEKHGTGLIHQNIFDLKREFEVCQPRTVISLGSIPGTMLTLLGIDHLALPHPGFYLRKSKPQAFVEMAKTKLDEYRRLRAPKESVETKEKTK